MSSAPPADLQRLIDFVNTHEVDTGVDALGDPAALVAWLAQRGLLDPETTASQDDLRRAHELRETLRGVLLAHHGDPIPEAAAAASSLLASLPLHVALDEQGGVRLEPTGDGVHAALARLVSAMPLAAADGSWHRTKACPADTCQWAFYDQSRNRSRRWCSMEVCGNREKSKSFRTRQTGSN